MNDIGIALYVLIQLYTLLVIIRVVVEMIASFSRSFSPPRWFSMIAEPIFKVTDPPIHLLRRAIPPLQLGGVALDVSVLVLFVLLNLLAALVGVIFI
ncbi:YggT family protein [Corynebacterium lizhenjunii]|uniref:YggT family protein n=1 Tax=Corynebacterium lizhenjunii TaxID=2709394 RepID=A0A7T0KHQ6_9CORY|nr:YggT family protein [Corynebacterium lizhenjunii]QPK80364.1 YggT family protein [Corynebacterium lizhenjunii]